MRRRPSFRLRTKQASSNTIKCFEMAAKLTLKWRTSSPIEYSRVATNSIMSRLIGSDNEWNTKSMSEVYSTIWLNIIMTCEEWSNIHDLSDVFYTIQIAGKKSVSRTRVATPDQLFIRQPDILRYFLLDLEAELRVFSDSL